jgi:hypothetical protein
MRKVYFFVFLNIISTTIFAQTVIFSDDFSTGLTNWRTVDNSGGGNWDTTLTGSVDGTMLNSTTAANGYVIFDSNGLGDDNMFEDADLISKRLNTTGISVVKLRFQQYMKSAHMLNTGTVLVSTDSINFTPVYIFSDGETSNPDVVTIDISAIAGNQDSVYIKFNYIGDYNYYWMIDDISVFEPVDYDLSLLEVKHSATGYSMFPKNQRIKASGLLSNDGKLALTNPEFALYYRSSTNAIVHSDSVSIATLAAAEDTILTPGDNFQFTASGNYLLKFQATSTEADQMPSNNSITESLLVTDSVFARDLGSVSGSFGFGGGEAGILGQNFTITSTTYATSISAYLTSPNLLDTVSAVLYTVDTATGKPNTLIGRTVVRNIFTGQNWYTMKMKNNPISLQPGTYFIGVNNSPNYSITLGATDSLFTPNTVWMKGTSFSDWQSLYDVLGVNKTFVLRLNVSNSLVYTDSHSSGSIINIYPNPASSEFIVVSEDEIQAVEIWDLAGKQIKTVTSVGGTTLEVPVSGLAAGSYLIKVSTNKGTNYQKINKQ